LIGSTIQSFHVNKLMTHSMAVVRANRITVEAKFLKVANRGRILADLQGSVLALNKSHMTFKN